MANIILSIEHGVEVAAEDVLKWLGKAEQVTLKGPQVLAALTTLISAVDKVAVDVAADAANPTSLINIPMDIQQFNDVKAVLPAVKAVFTDAGVKF